MELRPTNENVLSRLATLVENEQYWKEASTIYEKLYSLTKTLSYLQKRILADYHAVLLLTTIHCLG